MHPLLASKTQILKACDIAEFEERAIDARINMMATQLTRGKAEIQCRTRMVGNAVLSSYSASHSLAVDWLPRTESLNFSIQVGRAGMLFGGRERSQHSVVMYVEPAASNWTGVIPAGAGARAEAFHVSLPLAAAASLEVADRYLVRGLLPLEIAPERAEAFRLWAEHHFSDLGLDGCDEDQLVSWLSEFLRPILPGNAELETPSYYDRVIREVNRLVDENPYETPAVLTLASRLRISVRTLQRAFHATFGVGVGRYLRHRRLRAAHELLQKQGGSVSGAALATGFHHVARFSQQYRELFGCYPSETAQQDR